MAVKIHVNKSKMIDSVNILKHLEFGTDSLVLQKIKNYTVTINLAESNYTIGLQFLILEDGKPDSVIKPFDKTAYNNFFISN